MRATSKSRHAPRRRGGTVVTRVAHLEHLGAVLSELCLVVGVQHHKVVRLARVARHPLQRKVLP